MTRVERERGLSFRSTPGLDELARAELLARAVATLQSRSAALQRAHARLLTDLGLVPESFSWPEALAAALEPALLAFYDPERQRILIDRALPRGLRQRTLAHELVHVLADQHHALGARLAAPASSDRAAALSTLAEGDADAVVAALWPAPDDDVFVAPTPIHATAPIPAVLARTLAASYEDGQTVVRRVLDTGGYPALDALYRQPPDGTHALLAPTFPARPAPVIALPARSAPPGWDLLVSDVLGEQTWRTLLEEWLPRREAEQLARGWDGDQLALFERGTASVLVWEVRSDARRALAAERALIRATTGAPTPNAPAAPTATTPSASVPACRVLPGGAVMGHRALGPSLVLASLHDTVSPVRCSALADWLIPVSRARREPSDPGPPRLIGPP